MNIYAQRIEKIRKLMAKEGIGLYYIPMDDCHGSEYVGDYFRCIEFVSGFTGSAGQVLISSDKAWLYADGRYYVQAEKQLQGSGIELMKLAAPGVPEPEELIAEQMTQLHRQGLGFGFDGSVVNVRQAERFAEKISAVSGVPAQKIIFNTGHDLAGEVWKERPARKFTEITLFDVKFSGEDTLTRLARVRAKIEEELAGRKDYLYILSSLDDIAWIFNIRSKDIPCNLTVVAYSAIYADKAILFAGENAVNDNVRKHLRSQGVEIGIYSDDCMKMKHDGIVVLDLNRTNTGIYDHYRDAGCEIRNIKNPSTLMKGIKNDVELAHARAALLRDSLYVTKFMYRLKERAKSAGKGNPLTKDDGTVLTELDIDGIMDEYRTADPLYLDRSFETIAAYGGNAAMMHYRAMPDSFSEIRAEGMLLVDSGVQFNDGTTDITRTFILGDISEEEKKAFTLTAVSMLRLQNAKFISGCTGENLDIIAREPMWERGMDYKCGTGHGVGHVLNVHEGPHSIRWKIPQTGPTAVLEPGMVVTCEPGVYREGRYGVRTENEVFVKHFMDSEDGTFLCFEPMTYIPIDLDGIDTAYMSENDIKLLNEYHKEVFDKLSPYLSGDELKRLGEYTREV
ncbi:MAG: M24 family metallopeptidase [Lachnospiraceae bacterium]|jgi:Xaa-Pro aminopeptidase